MSRIETRLSARTAVALLMSPTPRSGSPECSSVWGRQGPPFLWQYLLGGLFLMGWSLLSEDPRTIAWSAHFVAGLLFLGLIGSGLASWVWYRLVAKGELIALNSLTLLTPVFALLLALVIYGEPLSKLSVLGIAMVFSGVVWVGWPTCRQ